MAHRANKRPPGRIKSSIVARLNTRLFFRLLGIGVLINIPGTEIEKNGEEESQRRQELDFQKVGGHNRVEKNPACKIPQEPGFPLQMGDLFPNLLFHQNPPPSRAFMSPRSFRRNRSCAVS